MTRIDEDHKNSKKFPDWIVIDNILYKFTKDELLDSLYDREEDWRLVVPIEYRENI